MGRGGWRGGWEDKKNRDEKGKIEKRSIWRDGVICGEAQTDKTALREDGNR